MSDNMTLSVFKQTESHFLYWRDYVDKIAGSTTLISHYPYYDSWLISLKKAVAEKIDQETALHVGNFIEYSLDAGDWEELFLNNTHVKQTIDLIHEILKLRHSVTVMFECIDIIRAQYTRFVGYKKEIFDILRTFIADSTVNNALRMVSVRTLIHLMGLSSDLTIPYEALLIVFEDKEKSYEEMVQSIEKQISEIPETNPFVHAEESARLEIIKENLYTKE